MIRNSPAIKIATAAASFFVSLAALEGSLRLAGAIIASGRASVFSEPYVEDPSYERDVTFEIYGQPVSNSPTVLCLGDSFTNGGNVASYDSYPYQLYRELHGKGQDLVVRNMGQCGDSAIRVLSKLESYLADPSHPAPQYAIILTGASDLYWDSVMKDSHPDSGNTLPWRTMLESAWYEDLRVYKMYRHIRLNLQAGILPFSGLRGAPEETPDLLSRPVDSFKNDDEVRQHLYAIKRNYHRLGLRPEDAIGRLLEFERRYPRAFWGEQPGTDMGGVQNLLPLLIQVQSRYTAKDLLSAMAEAGKAAPEVAGSRTFRGIQGLFKEWDRKVEAKKKSMLETWDRIVSLCRSHKIHLVVQTYPARYPLANEVARTVAAKYGLCLIENETAFDELVRTGGRAKYQQDDEHLTPEGYRILASRIAGALRSCP